MGSQIVSESSSLKQSSFMLGRVFGHEGPIDMVFFDFSSFGTTRLLTLPVPRLTITFSSMASQAGTCI